MFLGAHPAAFDCSAVTLATIEAYLATEFRIGHPASFTLIIGKRHSRLRSFLQGYELACAAVLTAWNPNSRRRSKAENQRAQKELIEELDRRRFHHFEGYGVDPQRRWPAEDSRLVLGINLATAGMLGRQFGQNAIVWAAGDGLPLLAMLR